jgi:hypothetical protein
VSRSQEPRVVDLDLSRVGTREEGDGCGHVDGLKAAAAANQ